MFFSSFYSHLRMTNVQTLHYQDSQKTNFVKEFIIFIVLLFFLGPSHKKVVACNLQTWARYRDQPGKFEIKDIEPSLCTHLIYNYVGLNTNDDSIKSLGKIYFTFYYYLSLFLSTKRSVEFPWNTKYYCINFFRSLGRFW